MQSPTALDPVLNAIRALKVEEEDVDVVSAAEASTSPRLAHAAAPSKVAESPALPATGAVSAQVEVATFTVTSPSPLELKASRAWNPNESYAFPEPNGGEGT